MCVARGKVGGFCLVSEYGSGSHSVRRMGEAVFFMEFLFLFIWAMILLVWVIFFCVNCAKGLLILFIFSRKRLLDLLILCIVFFGFPSLISAVIFTSSCLPELGLFCFCFYTILCRIIKSLCVLSVWFLMWSFNLSLWLLGLSYSQRFCCVFFFI